MGTMASLGVPNSSGRLAGLMGVGAAGVEKGVPWSFGPCGGGSLNLGAGVAASGVVAAGDLQHCVAVGIGVAADGVVAVGGLQFVVAG